MDLRLIKPPVGDVVTPEVARAHLRVDQDAFMGGDDALIGAFVAAAMGQVEEMTGRALLDQTWQATIPAPCWGAPIVLPRPPLIEIVSVESRTRDGLLTPIEASGYSLTPAGLMAAGDAWWPTGSLTITYRAGYGGVDDVPKPLVAAVLLALGELYESREASTVKPLTENPAFMRLTALYRVLYR